MRIVITGGAGFLGSHLCDSLIQAGHTVICMDNLLTGRMENISHLLGNERFTFLKYNVCDYLHVDGPAGRAHAFCFAGEPAGLSRVTRSPHSRSARSARTRCWD